MSTQGQVNLKTIFDAIDLYKGAAVDGELVEIIAVPYDENGKYDDSKRKLTIGLQGGFSRDRETFVFEDAKEFDEVILPQILAYYSNGDKLGKWDVTKPEIEGATVKGVSETENGNLFYVETLNPKLFDELDKRKEEVEGKTTYKKPLLTDIDKAWKAILSYAKGRTRLIDFSGFDFNADEQSELYRLIDVIADENLIEKKTVFVTKPTLTKDNIEELLKNLEVFVKNNFSAEFIEKVKRTIDIMQLAKLIINEKRFNQKFDREDVKVKAKVDFAKVQLGGLKSNYFGSSNHRAVIENLLKEYETSDAYTQEQKTEYTEYCNEILGLIDKVKSDIEVVEKTEVDINAPLSAKEESQEYTDDYERLRETVDLVRLGKKDEERYEIIVEPDRENPNARRVRISILDGVSRNDTFEFVFTDGARFDEEFREILDTIYKDDPNFMTEVQYVNVPGEETKRHSLRFTRDKNEILIKDAPESLVYEKTKLVDVVKTKEPPTHAPMAEVVEQEKKTEEKKVELDLGGKVYATKEVVEGAKEEAAIQQEIKKVVDGAKEEAAIQNERTKVVKGAREEAEIQSERAKVIRGAKEEAEMQREKAILFEGALEQAMLFKEAQEKAHSKDAQLLERYNVLIKRFDGYNNLVKQISSPDSELTNEDKALFGELNERITESVMQVNALAKKENASLEEKETERRAYEFLYHAAELEAEYMSDEELHAAIESLSKDVANGVISASIASSACEVEERTRLVISELSKEIKEEVSNDEVIERYKELIISFGGYAEFTGALHGLSERTLEPEEQALFDELKRRIAENVELTNNLASKKETLTDEEKKEAEESNDFLYKIADTEAQYMTDEELESVVESLSKDVENGMLSAIIATNAVQVEMRDRIVTRTLAQEPAAELEDQNEQVLRKVIIDGAREEAAIQSERTRVVRGAREEAEIQSERARVVEGAKEQAVNISDEEEKRAKKASTPTGPFDPNTALDRYAAIMEKAGGYAQVIEGLSKPDSGILTEEEIEFLEEFNNYVVRVVDKLNTLTAKKEPLSIKEYKDKKNATDFLYAVAEIDAAYMTSKEIEEYINIVRDLPKENRQLNPGVYVRARAFEAEERYRLVNEGLNDVENPDRRVAVEGAKEEARIQSERTRAVEGAKEQAKNLAKTRTPRAETRVENMLKQYEAILEKAGGYKALQDYMARPDANGVLTGDEVKFVRDLSLEIGAKVSALIINSTKKTPLTPEEYNVNRHARELVAKVSQIDAKHMSQKDLQKYVARINGMSAKKKAANPAALLRAETFKAQMRGKVVDKKAEKAESVKKEATPVVPIDDREIIEGAREEAEIQSERAKAVKGAREEAEIQSERTKAVKGAREEAHRIALDEEKARTSLLNNGVFDNLCASFDGLVQKYGSLDELYDKVDNKELPAHEEEAFLALHDYLAANERVYRLISLVPSPTPAQLEQQKQCAEVLRKYDAMVAKHMSDKELEGYVDNLKTMVAGREKMYPTVVIRIAAFEEELASRKTKKQPKEMDAKTSERVDKFLDGLLTAIDKREKKAEKVDREDVKSTTVSFEQLHEYIKKYKISNTNGPLEIYSRETGKLYTPSTEEEKRNIEFAYYWGVMVGKNDKNASEVVNMNFAFGEDSKKLFDIMDVQFKESLLRGLDIDFESLERQFVDSKVENAQEIFDSLFKTDPLRKYVTQYYQESLGMKVDKTDEFDKRMAKEYAEYRKLFDLNARRMLSETGVKRLNLLKDKKGPIEVMEKANKELYEALMKLSTLSKTKKDEEEYRKAQQEYNRLKRENDSEYQEAIREFNVPEDMLVPGFENNFYDILDTVKESGVELTDHVKKVLEYVALDKERCFGELTREQEDKLIDSVIGSYHAFILERERQTATIDGIREDALLDTQETFKNRILQEIKMASLTQTADKDKIDKKAEEEAEELLKEQEAKNEERIAALDLDNRSREIADYFKYMAKAKVKKLTKGEMILIGKLAEANDVVRELEDARKKSPEEYERLHEKYGEELIETIEKAAVVELGVDEIIERSDEEVEKDLASVEAVTKADEPESVMFDRSEEDVEKDLASVEAVTKADEPESVMFDRSEEDVEKDFESVVAATSKEAVPQDLVGYYALVKTFEKFADKYSVEKENNETKIYDAKTNIEYNPTRKDEKSTILLGSHWMRSVGIPSLVDNARLYAILTEACLESYGKEEGLDLDKLREAFVATGIENADVCFDNLFADGKAEFIREHIAHISDLSDHEKEHGVIPYGFGKMKDLVEKYAIDKTSGHSVERNHPEVKGPDDPDIENEIKLGNVIENVFGNHENGNKLDLTVFTGKLFSKLKMLVSTIKDMILNALGVDKQQVLNVMDKLDGGLEFAEKLVGDDISLGEMVKYVSTKYKTNNPLLDKVIEATTDKIIEAEKKADAENMAVAETPAVKEVDPVVNDLGDQKEVLPKAETPDVKEIDPVVNQDATKEVDPIVNDLGDQKEVLPKAEVLDNKDVMSVDTAVEELTGYMDMTYDFNETRKVPTSVRVFFSNENPTVGEVIFSTGSGDDEFTLFHQSFAKEDIESKILPVIAGKFAELNEKLTKVPAYEVQGRKKNELFYLGGEIENLFQVSNASQEMIDLADSLMQNKKTEEVQMKL